MSKRAFIAASFAYVLGAAYVLAWSARRANDDRPLTVHPARQSVVSQNYAVCAEHYASWQEVVQAHGVSFTVPQGCVIYVDGSIHATITPEATVTFR